MSGLDNLNTRLNYRGGDADGRINKDKLWSLESSLFNSYQGEDITLNDGRQFRCLLNPENKTMDYDIKTLSIPYQARCLNSDSHEKVETGIAAGQTFLWNKTNTHWLVFSKDVEEIAYFRAIVRRCDQQITVGDKDYWVVVRGPVETSIQWNQKGGVEWNDLNFSQVIYITRDDNTIDYFKRFKKLKMKKKGSEKEDTWEVVGTNSYYGDGIIQVFVDEAFNNTIEDEVTKENAKPQVEIDKEKPYIEGPSEASVYDTVTFVAHNFSDNGEWFVTEKGITQSLGVFSDTVKIDTQKAGSVIVSYRTDAETADITLKVNKF